MEIIGDRRIADVLADWGFREVEGRFKGQLPWWRAPASGPERQLAGLEIALTVCSSRIAGIITPVPLHALAVELSPEDLDHPPLMMWDEPSARFFRTWTNDVLEDKGKSGDYVRSLADSKIPVSGPLLCAARRQSDGSVGIPYFVFDGRCRGAAWATHARRGMPYSITADLILTHYEVAIFAKWDTRL